MNEIDDKDTHVDDGSINVVHIYMDDGRDRAAVYVDGKIVTHGPIGGLTGKNLIGSLFIAIGKYKDKIATIHLPEFLIEFRYIDFVDDPFPYFEYMIPVMLKKQK